MKKFCLIVYIFFLPYIAYCQISGYHHQKINGFDVYIEQNALNNYYQETSKAINMLSLQLKEINDLGLTTEILSSLHSVKFFMDCNTTSSAAVYHPNLQWLINNGYIPEKWQSVEISNINNFVNWGTLNQPYMILHELAHAYHDRSLNFGYLPKMNAYESAMSNSLYQLVSYHVGNNEYIERQAYASTNHLEYFAETTEAFLGLNDFYPFKKSDLKDYDPVGYDALSKIWKFKATYINSVDENFQIFPNPVTHFLNIGSNKNINNYPISIYTINGQNVYYFESDTGNTSVIDISFLISGVYIVNILGNNYKITKL